MEFNIGIFLAQLINFGIIFFLFKKFVADKLTILMSKRLEELKKADNAAYVFDEMVQKAEEEKHKILADVTHQKESIIQEAVMVANKKQEAILEDASKKATLIINEATQKINDLEKQLKDGFVDGVKATTKLVINKLVKEDVTVQNAYIDSLVNEFVGGK